MTDRTQPWIEGEHWVIPLSSQAPVKIISNDWPIVAQASNEIDHLGQKLATRHYIYVRRHADGRSIVYGNRESDIDPTRCSYAGFVCEAQDEDYPDRCPALIEDVGARIEAPRHVVDSCIAALPPTTL